MRRVSPVLKVSPVLRAHVDIQGLLALKVSREPRALRAQLVNRELLDLRVSRVMPVRQDPRAFRVRRGLLGLKGQRGHKEFKVLLE